MLTGSSVSEKSVVRLCRAKERDWSRKEKVKGTQQTFVMRETGAVMLAAFCARNVSRTALSASEWADILCVCLCPFPETRIVCGNCTN